MTLKVNIDPDVEGRLKQAAARKGISAEELARMLLEERLTPEDDKNARDLLSDEELTAVLSRQYGVPSVNLELFEVDPAAVALVPQETAERYLVLPLSRVGATLTLAMADPTNVFVIGDIRLLTGLSVEPVVVSETALKAALRKHYGVSRDMELAKPLGDLVAETTSLSDFGKKVDPVEPQNDNELDLGDLRPMSKADAWAVLKSMVGTVEGPADWSSELDHYLYGTPKRGVEPR